MRWNWFTQKPPPRIADEGFIHGQSEVIDYLNSKYGNFEYEKDARALDSKGIFALTFAGFVRRACAQRTVRRVLLTGANSGAEVEFLRNFDVTAVDLSDVALKRLSEIHPDVHVVQANIENLPFINGSFDLYVSMRSIHASNLNVKVALTECHRVTEGPLILSISNGYNIAGRLKKGMYNYESRRIDMERPYQYVREVVEFLGTIGYFIEVCEVPSEIFIFAEHAFGHVSETSLS